LIKEVAGELACEGNSKETVRRRKKEKKQQEVEWSLELRLNEETLQSEN
jgi:hypothetical protein